MNILTIEQLRAYKISFNDVRRAVNLTLNNLQYDRRTDIPKKFLDKVDNICKQIEQAGTKYFVTENVYSYTIWEAREQASKVVETLDEIPLVNDQKTLKEESNDNEINIGGNVFVRQANEQIEEKRVQAEPKATQAPVKKVRKYRGVVIEETDNSAVQNNLEVVNPPAGERKYRGAVIKPSNPVKVTAKKSSSPIKKTIRKYRGVIIEE